ncbi:MAG: phosphotransferase [Eubacteriales bacterium]|nr:phosphotransferase [Eubacteriales bacterium]
MSIKELRQIRVDGCEIVGRGAHGIVYKIAPDAVVKVYREDVPLERIKAEKSRARRALILGVPTAISFDIVKVGNHYGAVYELLDAESTDEYINSSRDHLESFIEMSTEMLKVIHAIDVGTDDLADMKADHLKWIGNVADLIGADAAEEIRDTVLAVPDSRKLLHGDFHMKNIIICRGEPMLIDMDTLSFGDPVFDLATMSNSYRIFPRMNPEAATVHLGISVEDAAYILRPDLSGQEKAETDRKIQILGILRILDFAAKGSDPVLRELIIRKGLDDLHEILQH